MNTPEPPAGSEHYREGWRHGYEQAAIDRERSADAVRLVPEAEVQFVLDDNERMLAQHTSDVAEIERLREDKRLFQDMFMSATAHNTAVCEALGLSYEAETETVVAAIQKALHPMLMLDSETGAVSLAGAVPDTGQAREATGRQDTAVEAAVAAWRDVQPRAFVMPEEMTELAIALDELTAAHETVSALVPRETTDDGRSRDAEPTTDTGQAPESPTASPPKAGPWGSGEAETATGTGQAPDVAALRALCDAADPVISQDPADCTRHCDYGPCDCSGRGRPVAWDLDPAEVRALLGTDTTPDRLAWISEAGETAAAARQARYQETACARRPASTSGDPAQPDLAYARSEVDKWLAGGDPYCILPTRTEHIPALLARLDELEGTR